MQTRRRAGGASTWGSLLGRLRGSNYRTRGLASLQEVATGPDIQDREVNGGQKLRI